MAARHYTSGGVAADLSQAAHLVTGLRRHGHPDLDILAHHRGDGHPVAAGLLADYIQYRPGESHTGRGSLLHNSSHAARYSSTSPRRTSTVHRHQKRWLSPYSRRSEPRVRWLLMYIAASRPRRSAAMSHREKGGAVTAS